MSQIAYSPPVTRVTDRSSERFLRAAASGEVCAPEKLNSAASDYNVSAFTSFLNDLFCKPFGFDLIEKGKALKDNFTITLAMALSVQPDDSVSASEDPSKPLRFSITNEYGEVEKHQLRECENDNGTLGLAHERVREDGTVEHRFSFVESGTIQNVRDKLNVEMAVRGVIERVTDLDKTYSEHRIDCVRFAFNYVNENPEKFADIGNEVADYKLILGCDSEVTCAQFKLGVACHKLENPQTDQIEKNKAAVYLLNNAAHLSNQKNAVILAARHVLNYHQDFSGPSNAEAVKIILRNTPGCQKMSAKQAVLHILDNPSINDPASIKSAKLFIQTHADIMDVREIWKKVINSQDKYHRQFVIGAAQYFVRYPGLCDTKDVTLAENFLKNIQNQAQTFFRDQKDFFTQPITDKDEFLSGFKTDVDITHLRNYTYGLVRALESKNTLIKISSKESSTGDKQKLSFLGAWLEGKFFEYILKENIEVADYILDNMDHPAMKIWKESKSQRQNSTELVEEELVEEELVEEELEEETSLQITPPSMPLVLSDHEVVF